MTIAVLCGSLEPGRDGVGDYSRWLAVAAERQGAVCRLVAIADRHIDRPVREEHKLNGGTLRLPFNMPWRARVQAASEFIASVNPDWLSIQFVPYSFEKRGIASSFVRGVPRLIGRARLHVMLHEIWIDGSESWARYAVSAAQRRYVLRLCRYPQAVVHTSNPTYRQVLRSHGVDAAELPLFGSIPLGEGGASRWLAAQLRSAGCDALEGDRSGWWLAVIFGTLHPVWPPQPLLQEFESAAQAAGRRVALISVGRLGAGEHRWEEMRATHADRIPMVRLGEQPANRISELFRVVDFGIATTPLALIGKSASAAALFDHGIPVIVNREDCCWPAPLPTEARQAALVIRLGPGFAERLRVARRLPAVWRLDLVATRWVEALGAAASVRV